MSYDRVLPNPIALRYESAQVPSLRPSNLLDHKVMNDSTKSTMAMRHPADGGPVGASVRYPDARSTGLSQTHQHMSFLNGGKESRNMPSNGPVKPAGPMIHTKELPDRSDRSSSSSASSTSPIKTKEHAMQFCLCQPDPKIPRPRNGESMLSAPSLELGKCFFDCFFFGSKLARSDISSTSWTQLIF
jgi:HMG box factor